MRSDLLFVRGEVTVVTKLRTSSPLSLLFLNKPTGKTMELGIKKAKCWDGYFKNVLEKCLFVDEKLSTPTHPSAPGIIM